MWPYPKTMPIRVIKMQLKIRCQIGSVEKRKQQKHTPIIQIKNIFPLVSDKYKNDV